MSPEFVVKKIFYQLKIVDFIAWIIRLIRNLAAIEPSEKGFESDRQLLLWVGRQVAMLLLVLFFFDDLLGFVIDVLHSVFEMIHLIIEVIEHALEELLEHTLHTDHHQSETILANSVFIIALYGIYRLFRIWPQLYRRWKRKQLASVLRQKKTVHFFWKALPNDQKIKLAAAYLSGIALLLYFLTL